MIKRVITFWIVAIFAANMQAQPVQVDAKLDTTVILIGDQIKLHIEVEKRNDASVTFPAWKKELTPQIEIVNTYPVDSATIAGGMTRFTQDVVITSFDSGRHEIPSIDIVISMKNQVDTVRTQPLSLDVYMMPTDTLKQIADIKPVYDMPIGWEDIWPWLLRIGLILLALAIIGFLVYAAIRRKNNKPLFSAPKPVIPPHITALRDLDLLRNEKLWQNNRVKEYYTRLSDIIRTYISGRFHVGAMEMTRDEILAGLKSTGFEDNDLTGRLRQLFTLADMVKFAKMEPLPNENETSLLDGYLFVNNTKLADPTPEPQTKDVSADDVSAAEVFNSIKVQNS